MLDFPLHEGFFPQIALSADEVKYYRRLGKERVVQLVRVIEDADCAYKWTDVATPATRRHRDSSSSNRAHCQQAQFLDFQPASKVTVASTLLKASVHVTDARVEEVLAAIAKSKTKDFRKTMTYLHGPAFVDGRTLFTFPTASTATAAARTRPAYSYRAIKWHVMQAKPVRSTTTTGASSANNNNTTATSTTSTDAKMLDFAYLEYAGKRRAPPGSSVVGFCVQESITREREVPTLTNFGIARGVLARSGIVVSRTHQPHVLKITAVGQVDGDLNPLVRAVLERVLHDALSAVERVKGLLERQRVSSLRFVEQWQWVPNADRKACAVCLRGFYFHRKHHCRTCGEVVCSSCAPLRELEEPIFDITQLRVCSVCMASASAAFDSSMVTAATSAQPESLSTSNGDTASYIRGLRSPQHNAYEDMQFEMRSSDVAPPQQLALEAATRPSALRERVAAAAAVQRRRTSSGSTGVRSHEKMQALTDVVSHIRDIRDTINMSISEVDLESARDGDGTGAGDDGDQDDASEELFNDVRSRMHRIRATLESSVHNFDAALANATHAPLYVHTRESPQRSRLDAQRRHRPSARSSSNGARSLRLQTHSDADDVYDADADDVDDDIGDDNDLPDALAMSTGSHGSAQDDNVMTPEQFASVARITFAAARATKQAGEAFLSSCGGGSDFGDEVDDVDDGDDDVSVHTADSVATGYSDSSQDPYAASNYDRVMASYQDDKRSRAARHGDNGTSDSSNEAEGEGKPPLKRKRSLYSTLSSTRRAGEILALERKIEELQRSLEDAQRKLSVFEDVDEPDPEQQQRGSLGVVYEESAQVEIESVFEVFGHRDSRSRDADSNASTADKRVTTYDLVTELRGVMNSSEMTKPTGRRSFTKAAAPPLEFVPSPPSQQQSQPKQRQRHRESQYPYGYDYYYEQQQQQRQSLPSFGAGSIMPSPIPRRKSGLASPTGSLDSNPGGGKSKLQPYHHHLADLMDNTASSSASGPHGYSFTSSNGVLVGGHVNADTSLESARYEHLMGSAQQLLGVDDDDDGDLDADSSDDDDVVDGVNTDDSDDNQVRMMGTLDAPKLRNKAAVGSPAAAAPALFATRELEPATPPRRHTDGCRDASSTSDRRNTVGERDESDELRQLMDGLGRPRSNSVPFRSTNNLSASSPDDRVGRRAQFDKPAWSDSMPNRAQSAYHMEQMLREVRRCLASFLVECPSGRERARKLGSIFKVLQSLHREGVRSKFRTLDHDAIRYAKVLHETPSLIRLLKLAGYVSLPQKLTMRHVDQPYIGVVLREIQTDLKH